MNRSEKLFILLAMAAGFCISLEYAVTRPASTSIFLGVFSAQSFPYVWLATVPLNFAIVYLYSRFLPRLGPLRMMGSIALSAVLINTLSAFLIPHFPQLIFFHFAWKDIYILLMFKQLWSIIHSTISAERSKLFYGIIFGAGTIGAVVGSLIPSQLAMQLGSEKLLLFTLPIYAVLFLAYWQAYLRSGVREWSFPREQSSPREALSMILKNRYLFWVLALVIFMQVTVALVEYQFSHHLELAYPATDARTAYFGKLMSVVNLVSLGFQFFGSYLFVRILGLRRAHFFVPAFLSLFALGQWAFPIFSMAACAFIFTKSIDFSLFGVIREMLYVPLKLDEKFRAKAVIDVFAYRTSKALVSFLLLGLQAIAGAAVFTSARFLSILILIGWFGVVAALFRRQTAERLSS